ncbi:MAG: hypothetical protein WCN92_01995 [Eubacteriales bacterium]
MSAFSLGGKTKIIFSKMGLLLLIGILSLAIFGACAQKASSVNANHQPTTAVTTSAVLTTL